MQKKIIALALAGLASSAAFAQSNVTIYGIADYGYSYRWDAENRTTGQHTRSGLDSGQQSGNRIGFKGTEDLGNGLKAVFLLEQGFNFDNSENHSSGIYGRQAYVGLTGGFGTLIGGKLYTPHFSFISAVEPFAAGTTGNYGNVWGAGLMNATRVNNAVAYVSPSFGGLDVTLAYSNSALAAEDNGDNAKNNTVYAGLVKYSAGAVLAGVNMHRIAAGSALNTTKTVDSITAGGTFDAKVVKLAALVGYTKADMVAAGADQSITNYMLGATVPVGKVALKTSVIYSDGNRAAGGDATQYTVGADYSLSKRTNLYSSYSLIDGQSTRAGTNAYALGDATAGATTAGAAAANNPYQQGLVVGVRHQF